MANSRRRCALKTCAQYQPVETMAVRGSNAWCSENHMIQWSIEVGRKLRETKAKEVKQKNRAELKAFQQKDHRYQFKLTRSAAQALANALDANLPCICCSTPRGSAQFCGGHYRTGGAHPEMALNLLNIHGQRNKTCNEQKSGNISGDKHSHGYKQGLIMRYGQWIVDYLDGYHPPRKFTCDELISMRAEMAAERKRLKKGLPPSKDWRAREILTTLPN